LAGAAWVSLSFESFPAGRRSGKFTSKNSPHKAIHSGGNDIETAQFVADKTHAEHFSFAIP
jgi:hypothetical protein